MKRTKYSLATLLILFCISLNARTHEPTIKMDVGIVFEDYKNILLTVIKDTLTGAVNYRGTYNVTTNTPALPTPKTENKGWYYLITDTRTVFQGDSVFAGDWVISNGVNWSTVRNVGAGKIILATPTNVKTALNLSSTYTGDQDLNSVLTNGNSTNLGALFGNTTSVGNIEGDSRIILTGSNGVSEIFSTKNDGSASKDLYLQNPGGNVLIGSGTSTGEKLQVNGKATVSLEPSNPTDVVRLKDLSPYATNSMLVTGYQPLENQRLSSTNNVTFNTLSSNGKLRWGLDSYTAGESELFNTIVDGTLLVSKKGTINDFNLINGAGQSVFDVPTSTVDTRFYGNISIGDKYALGGFKTLSVGSKTLGTPLIKLISNYNAGDGAEIWQNASGELSININSNKQAVIFNSSSDASFPGKVNANIFEGYGQSLIANDNFVHKALAISNQSGYGSAIYMGYNAYTSNDPFGIRLLQTGMISNNRFGSFAIQSHVAESGNDYENLLSINHLGDAIIKNSVTANTFNGNLIGSADKWNGYKISGNAPSNIHYFLTYSSIDGEYRPSGLDVVQSQLGISNLASQYQPLENQRLGTSSSPIFSSLYTNSNLGVGYNYDTGYKLAVNGSSYITNNTNTVLTVNQQAASLSNDSYTMLINSSAHNSNLSTAGAFAVNVNSGRAFTIDGKGHIGIGTSAPSEKLSVNGKIRAHEIKVETNNWPDYVFKSDYNLPTLQETEKHIKEKGHLPGIPSAAEVKANGIDLGEMNAKLLQKIEELTLHLIDRDKKEKEELSELKNVIEKLISRLASLENR